MNMSSGYENETQNLRNKAVYTRLELNDETAYRMIKSLANIYNNNIQPSYKWVKELDKGFSENEIQTLIDVSTDRGFFTRPHP